MANLGLNTPIREILSAKRRFRKLDSSFGKLKRRFGDKETAKNKGETLSLSFILMLWYDNSKNQFRYLFTYHLSDRLSEYQLHIFLNYIGAFLV